MYSTDGGELLFHTKSHIQNFIFFLMMIILSFFNINFGITLLIFLCIILFLLIWASIYGD